MDRFLRGWELESVATGVILNSGYEVSYGEVTAFEIRIDTDFEDGSSWAPTCGIHINQSRDFVQFMVNDSRLQDNQDVLYISEQSIDHDMWFELQIRVDPETMKFECLVDGISIGSYLPENVKELQIAPFNIYLNAAGNGSYDQTVNVDHIRLIPPYSQSEN